MERGVGSVCGLFSDKKTRQRRGRMRWHIFHLNHSAKEYGELSELIQQRHGVQTAEDVINEPKH